MNQPVPGVERISASEAVEHTRCGAVVVDARPQVVRHEGTLPGAIIVEPSELTTAFAPTSNERVVDPGTEIAVISVPSQAPRIAERIAQYGYQNVNYVDGGFSALRSAQAS